MTKNQLRALLQAHKSGDRESFRSASLQMISSMRSEDDRQELRALLSEIEDPSGFLLKMLGHRDQGIVAQLPKNSLNSLQLDQQTIDVLVQLKLERQESTKLLLHGLPQRNRVLLHGPPGCGKTSLAAALATEFGMNGYVIRLSEVRGSLMGETAAKLATAFRLITDSSALLLVDEIDVITECRTTDPSAASRENNASVATVLQLLDQRPNGLVIGATNRREAIDIAAMRRFDLEIEIGAPDSLAARVFARRIFERHDWPIGDWTPFDISSYAAIERDAMNFIRRKVLTS
jgi:SpoVK/Ycf46/Vps4 family AAA+-type ATPase